MHDVVLEMKKVVNAYAVVVAWENAAKWMPNTADTADIAYTAIVHRTMVEVADYIRHHDTAAVAFVVDDNQEVAAFYQDYPLHRKEVQVLISGVAR